MGGGMGGRRDGWAEGWVGGRMGGLQKLITVLDRFDTYKGGARVGFININDMYNNVIVHIGFVSVRTIKGRSSSCR